VVRDDARGHALRSARLRRREHDQRELGRVLDREDVGQRAGLVRRGADSVLDARVSYGARWTGGDGIDGHASGLPAGGARHLSRNRPEVSLPASIRCAGCRHARRPQPNAALRDAIRTRRCVAQLRRSPERRTRTAARHVQRDRTRCSLSAIWNPDAGPDREYRLRAGRSRRTADRPRPFSVVLSRAAALFSGSEQHLRLHRRQRHAPVPLTADRADAGRRAGEDPWRRPARRTHGRLGRRHARDADRGRGPATR
jgi:hypothetical protein